MKKGIVKILEIFLGGVFLVSGFGKLINIKGFVELIDSYGLYFISFLAPVIVIIEIALGILLMLSLKQKTVAKYSILMICIFTFAYLYGFNVKGIQDCGCFGSVDNIQTSPLIVLLRNGAILILLLFIIKHSTNSTSNNWKATIFVSVMVLSIFLSGFTYYKPISMPDRQFSTEIDTVRIKSILINRYINDTIADKTYLFFVFTFGCKHCWNSIENVLAYRENGIVDTVISVAYGDSVSRRKFEGYFGQRIKPIIIPLDTLKFLTATVPIAYVYKNGLIIKHIKGEIPSPFVFLEDNNN